MTQIENQAEQVRDLEQYEQVGQPGQKKQFRRRLPNAREALYVIWRAIKTGEELLSDPDPAVRLKALHALATVTGVYVRGLETVDVQAEIAALKKALKVDQ